MKCVIQNTALLNVPAKVGQNELSNLSLWLQSSNSMARSDIILETAHVRFLRQIN